MTEDATLKPVALPDWKHITNEQVLAIAPMMGNFTADEVVAFCAGFRRCAQAMEEHATAAILAERERCAKIVENCKWPTWAEAMDEREVFAAAIRGQQP